MITIICGDPGKGKTALMTKFAVEKMLNDGFEYFWKSSRRIEELKRGGFSSLSPLLQRHTVFSDYVIKSKFPSFQSYYVDGFKIGLPNPFFETFFFAPYSQIFLDEAQKYYDSRMSKYLRECVYRFYQLHRHNHLDIYMTCQRLANIDVNIRDISGRIIYVEDLKIKKDDFERIQYMTWSVKEFDSLSTAEKYIEHDNRNVKFEEKIYDFEGDIFQFYDSYNNEPVFYDGNYYKSFDCYTEDGYVDTIEGFVRYNQSHMYYAPVGYWKNEKLDAGILKKNS